MGEKIECPYCGKKVERMNNLRIHVATKHPEKVDLGGKKEVKEKNWKDERQEILNAKNTLEREQLARKYETVAPKVAILSITLNCPMRCRHCFETAWKRDVETMGKMKWFKILDKLKRAGVEEVVLEGGEPTTHPDFYEILEYATSQFKRVNVQTSGITETRFGDYDCTVAVSIEYPTPKRNNKLRRRTDPEKFKWDDEKGVIYKFEDSEEVEELWRKYKQGEATDETKKKVNDLVEPISKRENSFQLALRKLKAINNPKVLRGTVYSDNDVLALAMHAEKAGANSVFIPLKPVGLGAELKNKVPGMKKLRNDVKMLMAFNEYSKMNHIIDTPYWYLANQEIYENNKEVFAHRKRSCSAGVYRMFVNYQGEVYPCPLLQRKELKMGNILENDLNKVLHNIYKWDQEARELSKEKRCDRCLGGCLAVNYANPELNENPCIFPINGDLNG